MASSEAFKELTSSQIPALQLLINLGWTYLTPVEALSLREGKAKNVVLTDVLFPWLREHNRFERKGSRHAFSEKNIKDAVRKLTDEPYQSLITTNERVYELLTLGTSLSETINGDTFSPSLQYIDWKKPENNVYHVTEEFEVERAGSHQHRRPDIVLFVNGIPLVVIECKRADMEGQAKLRDPDSVGEGEPDYISKAAYQAISQMIRNQADDEIPQLFVYSQLLMAVHRNEAFYATTGTGAKFWSLWREETEIGPELHQAINQPLPSEVEDTLYDWRPDSGRIRRYFAELGERIATVQDRLMYSLLRPARLLELVYQFIVYDNGKKKIARYQQYFAIKATIDRVAGRNVQGTRTGGVIWHTTGSGKSLTMVMLAKALALHPNISNPRVVLVTDRVNLDDQIYGTFQACGKSVVQADNGGHLVRLITGKLKPKERSGDVVTTVINKFDQATRNKAKDDGVNIFVLVDESHRSQYGSMNARMQQVFPNACFIGFTGTPLTKSEKSTAERFGSFIHTYPMRQAVEDKAVVPLLYEGRMVEQDVDKAQLEKWFERATRQLNDEEIADLKHKMSRSDAVNATEQRIQEIAYDIAMHYERNWRGTGFKGQLATPSKEVALRYLKHLLENNIKAALVISPPDTREGNSEVGAARLPEVQAFWKRMMSTYRSEEAYNRELLSSFRESDGIEILIVVDKLLTGFDEPRNTVLYIDKPLKEHTLLQAIARVNRLAEGKSFGHIIDYRGVLGQLNEAMDMYDALAQYDAKDIAGTFKDVSKQIERLPQIHSDLWAIFDPVVNKSDIGQLEVYLGPEDRRQQFYETLTDYAGTLKIALATTQFYLDTPETTIKRYKGDLAYFHKLRQSVKQIYAEAIDYADYEDKVRKLMDNHVKALRTVTITELVNVFDVEAFDAEVAKLSTPRTKADTILNRMKRTIAENMDQDPAFYRKFSEMIEETIEAYRQGRIDELEYLRMAEEALDNMREGRVSGQPAELSKYRHAAAYYGALSDRADFSDVPHEYLTSLAIEIEKIIEGGKITDWVTNLDVQNDIKRALDELLYDFEQHVDLRLSDDETRTFIDQILEIAKARSRAG